MKMRIVLAAGFLLAGLAPFAAAQVTIVVPNDPSFPIFFDPKGDLLFVTAQERGQKPAEPAKPMTEAKPDPADAINLVFLGSKKPVLLRINILVEGKSVQAHRNDYIEKWFRYLDVGNRGFLTEEELKFAPSDQAMRAMMQGGIVSIRTGNLTLASFGREAGGKVTLEDLRAYYAGKLPPTAVVPQGNNDAVTYAAAGNALFRALDLNKDGKLSKQELLAAARTLRKFDLNDDEWITLQEITPSGGNNNNGNDFEAVIRLAQNEPLPPAGSPRINDAFYQIRAGDDRIGQLLLDRYDHAKVKKLTQKDLGLEKKLFAKLDSNKDGGLDSEELNRWHQRPADLEFTLRVGDKEAIVVERSRKPFAAAVKEVAGTQQLTLEDCQINLSARSVGQAQRGGNVFFIDQLQGFGSFTQQFRQADTKKQGFVEMKDVEGRQFQLLRDNFQLLDRDRDGKLTQQEVQAFAQLQSAARDCFVALALGDEGRAFFQLLDVNRDGRLSQRELLNAWNRLEYLDKQKKGYVVPADLTRQFHVAVQRGSNNSGGRGGFIVVNDGRGMGNPAPPRTPTLPDATPEWFRKMDRNGDGDVSLAEFLGTRAEFDRIDADHDGLISPEEAIRYDLQLRKANGRR